MTDAEPLAVRLAEFATATRVDSLPAIALERAKMSLASTVASAAMGFSIPSARVIRELDLRAGGTPRSTVWFDGTKLPPGAAARVNAVASDAGASTLMAKAIDAAMTVSHVEPATDMKFCAIDDPDCEACQ